MTIMIHNIESVGSVIVEAICKTLRISYSATISFVSDELYDYEINLEDKEVIPFMIRFFHKISSDEYERIEVF